MSGNRRAISPRGSISFPGDDEPVVRGGEGELPGDRLRRGGGLDLRVRYPQSQAPTWAATSAARSAARLPWAITPTSLLAEPSPDGGTGHRHWRKLVDYRR